METREYGDLERRIAQLETTVKTLEQQVRELKAGHTTPPTNNDVHQKVHDVIDRHGESSEKSEAQSLFERIKKIKPDSFQSKELAREEFINLVVQYWNILKPQSKDLKRLPPTGLVCGPFQNGQFYAVKIPDSFFNDTDMRDNLRESTIVLPFFDRAFCDIQPIYHRTDKSVSVYNSINHVIAPARCNDYLYQNSNDRLREEFIQFGLKSGVVE